MKKVHWLPFVLFACIISLSFNDMGSSSHFRIQKLTTGVWAAINNDSMGHAICNAGIVDLGDKTLVFDPFMNPDAAADLRKAAESLTGRPVSLVVNSHFHNDHIRGNQLFVPAARILSTEWTRRKLMQNEPEELAWERENAAKQLQSLKKAYPAADPMIRREQLLFLGYFDGMVKNSAMVKTTPPDITFSDSLWIHGSKRSVRLLERRGHTESDIILQLVADSIAFMGDLLFEKRHPWMSDGRPREWQNLLEDPGIIASFRVFVPGHGRVSGSETLKTLAQYLRSMSAIATEGVRKGLPDSVISASPLPGLYDDWSFRRFVAPNLAFLAGSERARK